MNEAREGQVAVEMSCGCDERTLVLDRVVGEWRCGSCRHKGIPTGRRITLGRDGLLPAGWQDDDGEGVAA